MSEPQNHTNIHLKALDKTIQEDVPCYFRFQNLVSIVELVKIRKDMASVVRAPPLKCPRYPFMFVLLESDVKFFLVQSSTQMSQLNSSIVGDQTMNSLIKLIGIEKDLNSAFEEAYVSGESKNVDLSVGDIYGSGSNVNFSLPKDLLASSMGKAQFEDHTKINPHDVVMSLWNALAINVGMFSALIAQTENLQSIVCHSTKITFEPWFYTLQLIVQTFGGGLLDLYVTDNEEYNKLL